MAGKKNVEVAVASTESEAYGKLKEDVFFTGFGFERACQTLKWLLEDSRFVKCGTFADVNEFLNSLGFEKFKTTVDQRADIVKLIKALQPEASNRAIAKALGVSKDTVRGDMGGEKSPPLSKKSNKDNDAGSGSGEKSPPSLSGDAAAKIVEKIETKKENKKNNKQRKANQRAEFDNALPDECNLFNCNLVDAEIPADSIDWIVTDPPYPKEFVALYADLAKMAHQWLKPGGSLLAMAGEHHLPEVLTALTSAGLVYQWTLAYLTPGGQAVQIFPKRVNTFWKPVLWLVKGEYQGSWIGDVVTSKVNDNDKRFHDWGQSESGFADLIERFAKVGDAICDPFMGGGTTGVVALARGMKFFGVEKDAEIFNLTKSRLSQFKAMGEAAE